MENTEAADTVKQLSSADKELLTRILEDLTDDCLEDYARVVSHTCYSLN